VGPFLAGGVFGPATGDQGEEVSEHLPKLMEQCRSLWQDAARAGKAHFYADSGSSAGKYLRVIDAEAWGWSVSYNKWTTVPERLARQLPEERWTASRDAVGRTGQAVVERHGWIKHMPGEECGKALDFAVVRWRTIRRRRASCSPATSSRGIASGDSANCSATWTCTIRPAS
jgi:hypothetical protein